MKQYCRYCSNMFVNNVQWCEKKKKVIRNIKAVNHCLDFDYNPMDALFENEKGYKPREKKEKVDIYILFI